MICCDLLLHKTVFWDNMLVSLMLSALFYFVLGKSVAFLTKLRVELHDACINVQAPLVEQCTFGVHVLLTMLALVRLLFFAS